MGGSFEPQPAFGEPDKNDWGADRTRRVEVPTKKKKLKAREEGDNFGARTTPKKDRRSSGRNWRDYTVGDEEEFSEGDGGADFDDDGDE